MLFRSLTSLRLRVWTGASAVSSVGGLSHPVARMASISGSAAPIIAPVFADDIVPLIRARHDFVPDNFYSAAAAVAGRMFSNEGWKHPDGSDCVAWAKPALNARLVYLQFGDGPATYANPHVRLLLANAIDFVASPQD